MIFYTVAYGYANMFAYCYKAGVDNKIYEITFADYQLGISYAAGEKCRNKANNNIYICATAITTSTTDPTGVGAGIADGDGTWNYVKSAVVHTLTGFSSQAGYQHPINYRGRGGFLSAANSLAPSVVWNGSTWAAPGFTYSATAIDATCLTNYRGRVYLFYNKYIYYSDLTGVTGACDRVDMGLVLDTSEQIIWCGTLVDSTNKPTESMLAFGTSSGEVLVYAGDNPAATNWEMIGRLKLSPVLNHNAILEIQGDIWIATASGVISLRRALSQGEDDLENASVSQAINPYWAKLVQAVVAANASLSWGWLHRSVFASMTYWPEENKVYVSVQGFLDKDGNPSAVGGYNTIFVCNLFTGGWSIHQPGTTAGAITTVRNILYFNNNIYHTSFLKYVYKRGTGYKDQKADTTYAAIPYALHSAYTNLGGKFKQCVGFEPLMKTDFTGASVTMKSSVDFGRKVSAACSHALIDGHQSPLYATGGMGAYLQYRMEGNTDVASTDGLELYSVGVAIK
jgi:hypothetical protein